MSSTSRSTESVAAAASSVPVVLGDVDGNIDRMARAARKFFADGARLVVLPELVTSGYVFKTPAEAHAAAIPSHDVRLASLGRVVPEDGALVTGFAEADGTHLFSSAAVIAADGVRGVYRKTHLWGEESRFFDAGDQRPPVIGTPVGRVGVAVCYDAEFPEVPRGLALDGADVLALPVNWPIVDRPAGERPPEIMLAMAAARASRLPIVIADRAGSERGVSWTDGTAIVGPDGWLLSGIGGTASAELDLAAARDKRIGAQNHLLDDRRPDLYGPLTER